MTPKDLKEYIKLCHAHGVTKLHLPNMGLMLELDSTKATALKKPRKSKNMALTEAASDKPIEVEDSLSDEELLMWSVNG